MVAGWVQTSSKYRKALESFTDELYHTNKIGGYKFGKANSASFHFFSLKQLLADPNLKTLEFKIRLKDLADKPALIFFLTTKQKTNEPALEPEILDVFESSKSAEILDLNKRLPEPILDTEKDLASPLTNEEKSPEEQEIDIKPKVNEKNDDDIEEIIKKMESQKQQPLFEEKPQPDSKFFEQANIEELTPVREDEEEEKPTTTETKELPKGQPSQETDFNDIIEELQKMKPEELKEFVASFEPDSRGKIANFLKDISKDEVGKPESFETGTVNPNPVIQQQQQSMPGFYNPMYQQQTTQHYYPPQQGIGGYNNMQGSGGFNNRPGKMYQPNNMRQGGYKRFGGNKGMYNQYGGHGQM